MAYGHLVAEEQNKLIKFGKTIGLSEHNLASRIVARGQEAGRKIQSTRRFQALGGGIDFEV